MTTGQKIGIIGGSVLVGSAIGYGIYLNITNKKLVVKLEDALKKGEGKQGGSGDTTTATGIQSGDYQSSAIKGEKLLTGQEQLDICNEIWNAKDYTLGMINKDSMAIAAFKLIKSKNQLSQVATFFNKLKQRDLYTFIQTFTDSGSQDFFTQYIKNLPQRVNA